MAGYFFNTVETESNPDVLEKRGIELEQESQRKVDAANILIKMVYASYAFDVAVGIILRQPLVALGLILLGGAIETSARETIKNSNHDFTEAVRFKNRAASLRMLQETKAPSTSLQP